jgi:hypothetical protein
MTTPLEQFIDTENDIRAWREQKPRFLPRQFYKNLGELKHTRSYGFGKKAHIVFVTGTRADFGKLEPLIISARDQGFSISIFITGMHLLERYGMTKIFKIKPTFEIKRLFYRILFVAFPHMLETKSPT